jgi:hypothetical protein
MLFRSSLLVSDSPNQGIELKKRSDEAEAAGFKQKLTNILSIRFRGFDPDRMLTAMNPFTAWFFTWPTFIAMLLLGIGAASLIFAQFDTFQAKLPSFGEFFEAKNWIWLALVMALTKVAHEFGHGLACKRFGGQCHEAGVMLLVLTPCLYMNVSDSWLLKSKWQRAFIAAAGMYVELIIASIAVFIWWFSQPGMVNQLALNVIFVSSVSTLLFNANPLLRYDGYYILSDLLEIPNLGNPKPAQQSDDDLAAVLWADIAGHGSHARSLFASPTSVVVRFVQRRGSSISMGDYVFDFLVCVSRARAVRLQGHRPDDRDDGVVWFDWHSFGVSVEIFLSSRKVGCREASSFSRFGNGVGVDHRGDSDDSDSTSRLL